MYEISDKTFRNKEKVNNGRSGFFFFGGGGNMEAKTLLSRWDAITENEGNYILYDDI